MKVKKDLYDYIQSLSTIQIETNTRINKKTGIKKLSKTIIYNITSVDKTNLYYYLRFIYLKDFKQYKDKNDDLGVRISKLSFNNIIADDKKINLYKNICIEQGLIKIDNYSTIHKVAIKYILTDKFFKLNACKESININGTLPIKKNIKHLLKSVEETNKIISTQTNKIFDEKIDISTIIYIEHLKKNLQFNSNLLYQTYGVTKQDILLSDFDESKYFDINYTTRRLSTIFTSTNKEYRKFYSLNNVNLKYCLDIKQSQASLFYSILELISRTEYEFFLFSDLLAEYDYNVLQQFILNNKKYLDDYKNIIKKDILYSKGKEAFIKKLNCLKRGTGFECIDIFRNFIYKNIKFGIRQYEFILNSNTKKYHMYEQGFITEEGLIAVDIDKYVKNRIERISNMFNDKAGNSQLSIFLMRVESYIMIYRLIYILMCNDKKDFLTIHDGIFTTDNDRDYIKETIERIFVEIFGKNTIMEIKIKKEN